MSGGGELRTPTAVAAGPEPCPTDDLLAAHFAGELSPEESGRIASHIDDCDTCRELAVAFQRGLRTEPDVLTPSRSGSGIPGAVSLELSGPSLPGAFAGRYQLRRLIGSGGMGAVYEALDVHLQRLIALKVLRLPPDQPAERAEAANRLVREARAMAKLSHRNVVAVYDVGIHNDQVFVAMQLIDGTTLRHWRVAQQRSSRQILKVLVEAGTGLASAHACGLVHRDFKPDNVLISKRGTARVTDFGLARRADLMMSASAADRLSRPKMVDVEMPPTVTRTGAIVGTPAYMAPEQAQGQPCDSRADQFSFCVAAWEALWGTRPFAGTTWSEIYGNVVSGNLTPPPMRPYVPWGVRRALERGLAVDPATRWGSMTDLLDVLEDAIRRPIRRRRVAIGAVTAVAASALAVLAWNQGVEPLRERAERERSDREASGSATATMPTPAPAPPLPVAVPDASPPTLTADETPTRKPARAAAVKAARPSPAPAAESSAPPPAPANPSADKRLSELGDALRGLESEWRRRELLRGDLPSGFFDAMHGVQAAISSDDADRGTAELARARAAMGGVVVDRRFVDAKAQRIGSQLGRLAPDQQDRVAALLREAAQLSAAGDHAAANRKLNAIAAQLGVR